MGIQVLWLSIQYSLQLLSLKVNIKNVPSLIRGKRQGQQEALQCIYESTIEGKNFPLEFWRMGRSRVLVLPLTLLSHSSNFAWLMRFKLHLCVSTLHWAPGRFKKSRRCTFPAIKTFMVQLEKKNQITGNTQEKFIVDDNLSLQCAVISSMDPNIGCTPESSWEFAKILMSQSFWFHW